ncbi:MAG: triosephosphate isomerase [Candidatus Omnitrophota bacterium]|nr:MAG: triosephosphate isomerase [Candidatus Omnitrophota bacterium]
MKISKKGKKIMKTLFIKTISVFLILIFSFTTNSFAYDNLGATLASDHDLCQRDTESDMRGSAKLGYVIDVSNLSPAELVQQEEPEISINELGAEPAMYDENAVVAQLLIRKDSTQRKFIPATAQQIIGRSIEKSGPSGNVSYGGAICDFPLKEGEIPFPRLVQYDTTIDRPNGATLYEPWKWYLQVHPQFDLIDIKLAENNLYFEGENGRFIGLRESLWYGSMRHELKWVNANGFFKGGGHIPISHGQSMTAGVITALEEERTAYLTTGKYAFYNEVVRFWYVFSLCQGPKVWLDNKNFNLLLHDVSCDPNDKSPQAVAFRTYCPMLASDRGKLEKAIKIALWINYHYFIKGAKRAFEGGRANLFDYLQRRAYVEQGAYNEQGLSLTTDYLGGAENKIVHELRASGNLRSVIAPSFANMPDSQQKLCEVIASTLAEKYALEAVDIAKIVETLCAHFIHEEENVGVFWENISGENKTFRLPIRIGDNRYELQFSHAKKNEEKTKTHFATIDLKGVENEVIDISLLLQEPKVKVAVGAQGFSLEVGAHTTKVNPGHLAEAGITLSIVGHVDTRRVEVYERDEEGKIVPDAEGMPTVIGYTQGDTDEDINKKLKLAKEKGLKLTLYVGEPLRARKQGKQKEFVLKQLEKDLNEIDSAEEFKTLISAITYEPIWPAVTDEAATKEQAQRVCKAIREFIANKYNIDAAKNLKILYAGSVRPNNVKEYLWQPDINGVGIGRASFRVDSFIQIVEAAEEVAIETDRTPFILVNWKATEVGHEEGQRDNPELFKRRLAESNITRTEVAFFVQYPLLDRMNRMFEVAVPNVRETPLPIFLQEPKVKVTVGAQGFSTEVGAHTTRVNPGHLLEANIDQSLVGHSETRRVEVYEKDEEGKIVPDAEGMPTVIGYTQGDTDEDINKKLKLAKGKLETPLCCGEPLRIRKQGKQKEFVLKQLEKDLNEIDSAEEFKTLIPAIAYEPIWAIGTGETATPEQAQEMHAAIREFIRQKYGDETAKNLKILYGGSVKPENAITLLSQPDVGGALIGGASLKAESFTKIALVAEDISSRTGREFLIAANWKAEEETKRDKPEVFKRKLAESGVTRPEIAFFVQYPLLDRMNRMFEVAVPKFVRSEYTDKTFDNGLEEAKGELEKEKKELEKRLTEKAIDKPYALSIYVDDILKNGGIFGMVKTLKTGVLADGHIILYTEKKSKQNEDIQKLKKLIMATDNSINVHVVNKKDPIFATGGMKYTTDFNIMEILKQRSLYFLRQDIKSEGRSVDEKQMLAIFRGPLDHANRLASESRKLQVPLIVFDMVGYHSFAKAINEALRIRRDTSPSSQKVWWVILKPIKAVTEEGIENFKRYISEVLTRA